MPIEIKILHNGIGILYYCCGVLTGKDYIDANNQILSFGDDIKQLRYGLVDEMGIDNVIISESEKMTIVKQEEKIARLIPYGAVVAVIAKSAFTLRFSRLWGSATECADWEIETFRDRTNAENWIRKMVKENFGIIGLKR